MISSLRDLKTLIREMALDAIGGTIDITPRTKGGAKKKDPKGQFGALKKFTSSKKYENDAVWMFRNFSAPIWLIPGWDKNLNRIGPRLKILSLEEALPGLLESGIGLSAKEAEKGMRPGPENEALRTERINAHLARGGTIIISAASGVARGFWPSPWMILHGLFDDGGTRAQKQFLSPYVGKLENWLWDRRAQIDNFVDQLVAEPQYSDNANKREERKRELYISRLGNRFFDALGASMTTGSARSGLLTVDYEGGDIPPESLVQALTHSQGFHLNWDGIEERIVGNLSYFAPNDTRIIDYIKGSLKEFEELVNGLRDELITKADVFWAGKIIWTKTGFLEYSRLPDLNRGKNT
jgi:hypothetical protein